MESESGQSDVTTIDPTRRIIKYFSKCLIELIKHAESIQFKNNKIINYDVSSTVNYDSGNEIDITEHNIKTETKREGPVCKQIERIKQCIVELLTICSQQNILIDYDTSKPHVAIYDGFDDSQRILVMNHLTLHTLSIVENIYMSVKFFKSSKYIENGQQIKRTFSNIYKEIKSLPMLPDIIDNMDSSFKSLTHKSEYKDSYNYLVEKLNILCKSICKFNKTYLKKCGCTTEDSTDDDNSPRKNTNKIGRTYIKPENVCINVHEEQETVFKIPETIENVNPNKPKQSNENKKRKINTDAEQEKEKEKENTDGSENMTERDLLLNELLNNTINEQINSEPEKRRKKKKKNKTKTKDTNTLENKLNDLNNTVNAKQNNTECNNLKNKNKNENNENLNDSVEKTNKDVIQKEDSKKRRNNTDQIENDEIIKRRKLDTRSNSTEEKNNKKAVNINEEENDDELTYLATHFLSNNESFERSNQSNASIGDENDIIPANILTAISNGDIEIDYDNEEFDEFTKIVKDNNLNEHERFLYIQDLIDSANTKLAIPEERKEKIKNLNILVDWEVCPAHLVCSTVSGQISEEEKETLANLGVTAGQFSTKEDKILRKNWNEFCQTHDLEDDPAPFLLLVVEGQKLLSFTERKKFLQFLGRGLPHKSLHSVYRRFKRLYKPKVKSGRFTPEEDQLILTYLSQIKREDNRQKYVRLAPLINRDRLQIERRYRVLKQATEETSKKIVWTLNLKEKFLKHLLEETQSKSVEDLYNKNIDFNIYLLIGKLMNIPAIKLQVHWTFRLHTELFAAEPINTDLIKIKIIKKFKELKFDDWKTVDWKPVKAMFEGFTKKYLWITLKNIVKMYVPDEIQNNLKACIDHLYNVYLPTLETKINSGKERILSRLRYEDGTLIKYK